MLLPQYAHLPSGVPTVANGGIQIASQTFPDRFGSLSDGYAVIANRTLFYGPAGSYEPGVLAHDVATQNTVSVGAAVTLAHGVLPAPGFRGHVLAVNGDSDAGNCVQPGCGSLVDERSYYAAATSFEARECLAVTYAVDLKPFCRRDTQYRPRRESAQVGADHICADHQLVDS